MPAKVSISVVSVVLVAAASLLVVLPGSAGASAKPKGKIRSGFYSSLVGHPSADVEFHARANGTASPDLILGCLPVPSVAPLIAESGYASIEVKAPKLKIAHGHIHYSGTASVSAEYAGAPSVGETTLSISLTHVDGPVVHYRFEGNALHQTTAWKGTASSPACATVADHGSVKLFGPVAGE